MERPGSFRDAMTATLRGLRTAAITIAGAILVGWAFYLVGSGPLWPIGALLALLSGGVAGGLAGLGRGRLAGLGLLDRVLLVLPVREGEHEVTEQVV